MQKETKKAAALRKLHSFIHLTTLKYRSESKQPWSLRYAAREDGEESGVGTEAERNGTWGKGSMSHANEITQKALVSISITGKPF